MAEAKPFVTADGGSRMSRNAHIRFWERVGVRFPRATHLVVFGEAHLRYLLDHFLEHYHLERPHQGLGNRVLSDPPLAAYASGAIECKQRLGGVLKHYCHQAA